MPFAPGRASIPACHIRDCTHSRSGAGLIGPLVRSTHRRGADYRAHRELYAPGAHGHHGANLQELQADRVRAGPSEGAGQADPALDGRGYAGRPCLPVVLTSRQTGRGGGVDQFLRGKDEARI